MAPLASLASLFLLSASSFAAAITYKQLPSDSPNSRTHASNIPLIIWHGLGDAFDSEGIQGVGKLYQDVYPGSTVYSIGLAADGAADSRASWFGSVTQHLDAVCHDLHKLPALAHADAVNAIGFSQGGQFLRGFVERCNNPPVRSLVTLGAQHNGIAQYRSCEEGDALCEWISGIARANTWGGWTQSNVVPAQYFRDPEDLPAYLESSAFLADVNNERREKNITYVRNLESLQRFAMYMFGRDTVVHPKESSWFAEVNQTTGKVTKLQDRQIYKEDWLGLKTLDKQGALVFETIDDEHMHIPEEALKDAFKRHMAPGIDKKPGGLLAWLGRLVNDHEAL